MGGYNHQMPSGDGTERAGIREVCAECKLKRTPPMVVIVALLLAILAPAPAADAFAVSAGLRAAGRVRPPPRACPARRGLVGGSPARMTAQDDHDYTTSTLSRGEALRAAKGGRQASDAVDPGVKSAYEMAQALSGPGGEDAAPAKVNGLQRASQGQRRETQTLLRVAGQEMDAQGLPPTPASALRRETQTLLRIANEDLDRKEVRRHRVYAPCVLRALGGCVLTRVRRAAAGRHVGGDAGGRRVDGDGVNAGALRCPRCTARLLSRKATLVERAEGTAGGEPGGEQPAEGLPLAVPLPDGAWEETRQHSYAASAGGLRADACAPV